MPTVKETHTNTSPSQFTQTNTDNLDFNVKESSRMPSKETLGNFNSEGPASHVPTRTDSIQTTQPQEPSEQFLPESKKSTPKTTHTPFNSTTKLPLRTIHISPTISPTKVAASSLLSSVFTAQNDAKLTADADNVNSSGPNLATSEQPTVLNVNNSTDEIDFEVDDKDTKKGNA